MKFCRNLQRVIDITDPEWAPYWTNYKMLKKFLKTLPSIVPPEHVEGGDGNENIATAATGGVVGGRVVANDGRHRPDSPDSDVTDNTGSGAMGHRDTDASSQRSRQRQDHGDTTSEQIPRAMASRAASNESQGFAQTAAVSTSAASAPSSNDAASSEQLNAADHGSTDVDGALLAKQMSRNPGEVAFFKLLNSELKKATRFFHSAQIEFSIRESRVREGIEIMRTANSLMVSEKWTLMAKSLYRLYKDLLLLETYAIMTYCSFSKILKKHDKVTKHNTRIAFMKNVVNKANFTHYPKVLEMISRCEKLYEEVSQSLILEGKSGLYEDERLFINMIHRLNEQVLDTAEEEGAPDVVERKEQKGQQQRPSVTAPYASRPAASMGSPASSSNSSHSAAQVSTLRSLVEENAMNKSSKEGMARVSESENYASSLGKIAAKAQQNFVKVPAAGQPPLMNSAALGRFQEVSAAIAGHRYLGDGSGQGKKRPAPPGHPGFQLPGAQAPQDGKRPRMG